MDKIRNRVILPANTINIRNIEKTLIEGKFHTVAELELKDLNSTGLYCIKLKSTSSLPKRYAQHLRFNRLLYIGGAKDQSLQNRLLKDVLNSSKPATFFRSIGAVLGYTPPKGSLVGKSNTNNYKFSPTDNTKIIAWLRENVEVSYVFYTGDFSIEAGLIGIHLPLLNLNHNPKRLQELEEDRAKCRNIANTEN